MTVALLDVNVLVALFDADHVDHARAWEWFDGQVGHGWASCAITQNGFLRVISQPRYPSPIPTAHAAALLSDAVADSHHVMWPCDVSVLDDAIVQRDRLLGPRQVTDTYLLALAVAHGGRFATFDTGVNLAAAHGATAEHLVVI